MKRKNLILALLPIIMAIFAFQSCTEETGTFSVFGAFSEPTPVAPLDGSLIKITGTTTELKWASTDPDSDAPKCDVYFGMEDDPALFKADHNALSLSVPVAEGNTYYWKIKMKDANGVMTTSPIFSFSVAVNYDINNFVGVFDCDEPGYGHYDCNFTKSNATTVKNDNFWDSGWAVEYVFDDYGNVTIKPITYSGYNITGHGKFNNTAKSFYVDYLVTKNGATIDSNTHTFVKK